MNRLSVIAMGLLVVGLTVLSCAYMASSQSDAGWATLIDGTTGLDNWNRIGDANWRAEDGAIVADKGKGGFLVSKNSEVNIFDQRPEPSYGTGAIVNVAKVSPMPKAGGKWNTYEITAKGSQLTVVLNGVQTVSVQDSQHAQGPFALQFGNGPKDAPGGVIKWRKVQIKSL